MLALMQISLIPSPVATLPSSVSMRCVPSLPTQQLLPCPLSLLMLSQDTGQLYLLEELDCEATGSYSLTVTANNSLTKCPLSSSVEVVIIVNDVNDNSPEFSEETYNTTVAENIAISSTLLTLLAEDNDKNVSRSSLPCTSLTASSPAVSQ